MVKQIHYKRIEIFTIRFNHKSIIIFSSNLLIRPRANFESMDSFFPWIYYNTSTHAYGFEIPLKGFRSPSVIDLCSNNQVLPMLDCRSCFGRCLCSQKVQHLSYLIRSKHTSLPKVSKTQLGFPFYIWTSQNETLNIFAGLDLI